MLVYNYSKETFAYTDASTTTESPLEPGVYILPANATFIPPPPVGKNQTRIFNEETEKWSIVSNFVGHTFYDKSTKQPVIIEKLGEPSNRLTNVEPSSQFDVWDENSSTWSTNLEEAKISYKSSVDKETEKTYAQHVTVGAGQTLIYEEKYKQARDYIEAGHPTDLSDFPFIEVEIELMNTTAKKAANDIIKARKLSVQKMTQIEKIRRTAKKEIDKAQSVTDMENIFDSIIVDFGKL